MTPPMVMKRKKVPKETVPRCDHCPRLMYDGGKHCRICGGTYCKRCRSDHGC